MRVPYYPKKEANLENYPGEVPGGWCKAVYS